MSSQVEVCPWRLVDNTLRLTSSESDSNDSPSVATGQPALVVIVGLVEAPRPVFRLAIRSAAHPRQRLDHAVTATGIWFLDKGVHCHGNRCPRLRKCFQNWKATPPQQFPFIFVVHNYSTSQFILTTN